jgi:hypothetical protein
MRAPLSSVLAVPELLRAPPAQVAAEPTGKSTTTSTQQRDVSLPVAGTATAAQAPPANHASANEPRRVSFRLAGSVPALLSGLVAAGLLAIVLASALRPGGAHRRR